MSLNCARRAPVEIVGLFSTEEKCCVREKSAQFECDGQTDSTEITENLSHSLYNAPESASYFPASLNFAHEMNGDIAELG